MYRGILDELLATTSGAFAAIFLDWEGETVQLVCDRDISDHDLRIIGAYQGIFMSRLRDLCTKTDIGPPQRFKIEFQSLMMLICDVRDGYSIVLLLDSRANEGFAWHQMDVGRRKLMAEM
ncbi:MAG TPA: hypothetical protein VIM68_12200 [Thermoanaerobaculia bacterium]